MASSLCFQRLLERRDGGVHRGLLHVDLGAAAPEHHQAIAAVPLFERTDVADQLVGKITLVLPLLDVGAVEAPDIALIENGGHGRIASSSSFTWIELCRFEHACRPRRRVAVRFEDVPPAKHDVVQIGQRHKLFDGWRALLRALAEPDRAHLRQRSDRRRQALADGAHAGNGRRADRTETDKENPELPARGSDLRWCGHNRPLYHGEIRWVIDALTNPITKISFVYGPKHASRPLTSVVRAFRARDSPSCSWFHRVGDFGPLQSTASDEPLRALDEKNLDGVRSSLRRSLQ